MIHKARVFISVVVLVFSISLFTSTVSFAGGKSALKEAQGKMYYTAVNIWYEEPDKIPSTNYHKGQIIPVNTPVVIGSVRKSCITFTDSNKVKYSIEIVSKHTPIPLEDLFRHYFSASMTDLKLFTSDERANIENGTIAVGMSKEAVVVAYGYPPAHMTPSLDRSPWKYWKDRFRNFLVYFNSDAKVSRMGDD
ncbi:MAG: hypothetical protein HQL22_02735 [Candidatus Omnitrophica bacterium]|nr:hypothetical protein [Candidatus Omnitrophota bacterium]